MNIQACVLLLSLALFAGDGMAHAAIEQAEPAPRSEFSSSPPHVLLKFNEAVESGYSTITVENHLGRLVSPTDLSAPDQQSLLLTLPPLRAGKYTVRYRVLSADGHVIDASYDFRVRPPEPAR